MLSGTTALVAGIAIVVASNLVGWFVAIGVGGGVVIFGAVSVGASKMTTLTGAYQVFVERGAQVEQCHNRTRAVQHMTPHHARTTCILSI
jgi:hypothetical protein